MAFAAVLTHSDLWLDFRRQTGRDFFLPEERAVLEEFAELIAEYIINRWPRDTGRSGDAWQVFPLTNDIGFRIENPVAYSPYVHRSGEGDGGPLIDELIESLRVYLSRPLSKALQAAARRAEGSPSRGRGITIRPGVRPSLRVVQGAA